VVRVGAATNEIMATLVVTNARDARLRKLSEGLARDGGLDGLHVNVLEGASSWLFGPATTKVHGLSWLREEIAGVSFLISPTAFFQTNVEAASSLVRLVSNAVPAGIERVIDLYAGVGLFALPLARRGHRVLAIEENADAVRAGQRSQRLNEIDESSCRFVRARAEEALSRRRMAAQFSHVESAFRRTRGSQVRLKPDATTGPKPDATRDRLAVVLDPPRAGCSPKALRAILSDLRPDVIVYVSCEPAALARDLAECTNESRAGSARYDVESVQPVDMFPHTPHVEAVAVLRRRHGSPEGRA
jgi:23S rRNA (uracil1939-C5)-methyltransferase